MDDMATGVLLREVARLHLQMQRGCIAFCDGTTSTQCFILGEVGRTGPMTLADLGRQLGLDKGWTSRAVESLVQEGLLLKEPSETDKRAVIISLSRAGKRRYEKLNNALNEQSEQVMSRIPASRRAGVEKALRLLHEALQAESACGISSQGGRLH